MKTRIDLTVEPRETGKHNSRGLRTSRNVPAVIYGAVTPTNVSVGEKEIVKYNTRAYENALFNLKSTDKTANGIVVLIKSVDVHPLSRRPQHVDFFALDLKKAVRVNVEVRLEGKPIGLSEGGLLNVVLRSVEVECLPTEIPEFLTADISNLAVGDALHVSDIKVAGSVKMITGAEQTLAVVNAQEEEVAATPAATPAAAAAPAAAAPAAAKAPAAKK
ncbi:50S ribosomal protein L25 [Bdellovibrio bacteriovorus]|uniref:50S ribosomal protein L25 n=1 Tax=Bdellovibrio bacteriovorus TaxID=959 RepID=UPI0035A73963